MNITELIAIIKKKIRNNAVVEKIEIEDKTFLHKNHSGHKDGNFHLKIKINSIELQGLNKIEANKRIYKALDQELKDHIHSLQIFIR